MKYLLIFNDIRGDRTNQFIYGTDIASIRRQVVAILHNRSKGAYGALVTDRKLELVGQIYAEDGHWYYKTPAGRPFRIGTSGRRIKG